MVNQLQQLGQLEQKCRHISQQHRLAGHK